jgi:hypothetical protein
VFEVAVDDGTVAVAVDVDVDADVAAVRCGVDVRLPETTCGANLSKGRR